MPPIGNPHATFEQDEAFRQSVIRKALLLGFSCEEYAGKGEPKTYTAIETHQSFSFKRWDEQLNGWHTYTGYSSIYSAAYDYLRLMKIPPEVIGDYRG